MPIGVLLWVLSSYKIEILTMRKLDRCYEQQIAQYITLLINNLSIPK